MKYIKEEEKPKVIVAVAETVVVETKESGVV